jgi:hypothetical protein
MSIANRFIRRFDSQIAATLGAVRRAERFLGPDDDWVEDDRRIVYEAADSFLRPLGRPTVREKGTADYVVTADADSDAVEEALDPPYQRNLLSTRKYRYVDGHKQWAAGSWVYDPDDTDWQHHVYLFERADGRTDIYAHREASVRNPSDHHGSWQTHGDPRGRVRRMLADANIDYESLNI